MTKHELAFALGYLGSLFGVVMVIPQIARVIRHPDRGGVSAFTWGIMTTSGLAWLSYGLRTASLPQVPGNALLVTGASIVTILVPARLSRRSRILRMITAACAVLTLSWTLPAELVGYLGFGIGLFSSLPQVYESVGTYRSGVISGVSVTTWLLRSGSQLCWLGYALLARDIPVLVSAGIGITTSVTLVALEGTTRLRAAWSAA